MTFIRGLLVSITAASGLTRVLRKAVQMQTGLAPEQASHLTRRRTEESGTISMADGTKPLKSQVSHGASRHYRTYSTELGRSPLSSRGSSKADSTQCNDRSPSCQNIPSVQRENSENGPPAKAPMRTSRVPSSRLGRLFHYGGLAVGVGWGTASEALRRATLSGEDIRSSAVLTEANVRRLVDKLTKMRGAALKLGQFMSIQDAKILPPQLENIFVQIQSTADCMPFAQTEGVLRKELGSDWRTQFSTFGETPIAAASIGQVHPATVNVAGEGKYVDVAVKVQFPGVFESIRSDLSYLSLLANSSGVLPSGLFLSKTLEVLGQELEEECDYRREARCCDKMREFLQNSSSFTVPKVFGDLSTGTVLTAEFMHGKPLSHAPQWPRSLRNKIGYDIMELCLKEIFHFRLMQTDPNWSNFLWNESTQKIELIDFGATREYSKRFVDQYLRLLLAGINEDRDECIERSREIGYFTGGESQEMLDSQFNTLRALGEPFRKATRQPFDFSQQGITDAVRAEIPVMIKRRLKPPPVETYSLHRKLSGVFLLCNRLGSQIDCAKLLASVIEQRAAYD